MKVIMAGDIIESVVQSMTQALPYTEEAVLRGILEEGLPRRGIVIEATKEELSEQTGNLLYKEVAVTPSKRLGKWLNGDNYEYEFACCSECGHMQWAGWDSHSHACEEISDFHKKYKFCPNCGASMVEGVYINGRRKKRESK